MKKFLTKALIIGMGIGLFLLSGCDKSTSNSSIRKVEDRLTSYYWIVEDVDSVHYGHADQRTRYSFSDSHVFSLDIKWDDVIWTPFVTGQWTWLPETDEIILDYHESSLGEDVLHLSILSVTDLWFEMRNETDNDSVYIKCYSVRK